MTRTKFVLVSLAVVVGLAAWGWGIAWGFSFPVPKGANTAWQGIPILFGPLALALLGFPLYYAVEQLVGVYCSLPSGRAHRLQKREGGLRRLEAEIAAADRELREMRP